MPHSGERGPLTCQRDPEDRARNANDGTIAQFSGQCWTELPAWRGRLTNLDQATRSHHENCPRDSLA
jgi:hypothetical protein